MISEQSTKKVFLKKLYIKNLGPIIEDEVVFEPFTYFVGRNNAGKSHYLRAIELLLSSRNPKADDIVKLQNNKSEPIEIKGYFEGVQNFTHLVSRSNHKEAIDRAIKNNILEVTRILDPLNDENTAFGVKQDDGSVFNPSGFTTNLLKILSEPIPIFATADTVEELTNKSNTALSKLKKEVLISFFEELRKKTKEALGGLDSFLHSEHAERRSPDLRKFEQHLKDELMGEFSEVRPSVEFNLPDEEVIAKEMRIILDDGHPSKIEQKGHGLQRAALLAMLRVLAKHGAKYQDRPAPIFLIGEIETFLHPYAQKLLAEALDSLIDRYQVVTSTHSPFIISPGRIAGYKRITKKVPIGAKNTFVKSPKDINITLIKRHLERRGNLEGLFADRIILIEGKHDEGFYERIRKIFGIAYPHNKFTLFVKAGGKEELRQTKKFYQEMGFDDVAIICDIDYLFSNDIRNLFKELKLDNQLLDNFRKHIEWSEKGDPPLDIVVSKLFEKGYPKELDEAIKKLSEYRIFVLRKGAPEHYCKNSVRQKKTWEEISSKDDLLEPDYLKDLMVRVISG